MRVTVTLLCTVSTQYSTTKVRTDEEYSTVPVLKSDVRSSQPGRQISFLLCVIAMGVTHGGAVKAGWGMVWCRSRYTVALSSGTTVVVVLPSVHIFLPLNPARVDHCIRGSVWNPHGGSKSYSFCRSLIFTIYVMFSREALNWICLG